MKACSDIIAKIVILTTELGQLIQVIRRFGLLSDPRGVYRSGGASEGALGALYPTSEIAVYSSRTQNVS